jgi:RNA polymerase sigma factor (sigma-70 family)
MEAKTVAELVDQARSGSAEARNELVRRYHRETAILAAAMVNDRTEAEDLAQEAFIRAFRNLDLLVDPGRFGAWLRRIVVGVSIDWLRSFRPDLYRGWSDTDEMVNASQAPSPLEYLLQSEMVRRVAAALEALPPRYRVPIRLYHLDGLSHAKIAATLDIPVATVRSLVARARKKLAPLLAEYAPEAKPDIQEVLEEQIVTHSAKTRFLHVANGTCTTRLIEAAGIPGKLSIWADPLYEGPVPGGLSDEELLDVRRRHHAGPADNTVAAWGGSDPSLDPVNDMRQWRATIERHDSYDELILWFEHDLFDQLSLIQLLAWIRERLPTTKPVSLVCVGSFPGRPDFKGLGELTPDELASLLETRQRLGEPQYALAERAWQAFREPTPEALDDIRQGDTAALPYLAAAVTRFLQEYPWTVDGLSRTERRLLELASGDGIALSAAFRRMHDGETVYYVTDTSLAELAEELSRTSPPLLMLLVGSVGHDEGLRGTVTLTGAGRAVLAGQLDRVAACGIDRWLGGVHLQRGGTLWRWDDTRQGVRRA